MEQLVAKHSDPASPFARLAKGSVVPGEQQDDLGWSDPDGEEDDGAQPEGGAAGAAGGGRRRGLLQEGEDGGGQPYAQGGSGGADGAAAGGGRRRGLLHAHHVWDAEGAGVEEEAEGEQGSEEVYGYGAGGVGVAGAWQGEGRGQLGRRGRRLQQITNCPACGPVCICIKGGKDNRVQVSCSGIIKILLIIVVTICAVHMRVGVHLHQGRQGHPRAGVFI